MTWPPADHGDVVDEITTLRTISGARVLRSAAFSVPNGAWTVITWDAESSDDANYHSLVTNTSRLTAPAAGLYIVGYSTGNATAAGGATGRWASYLRLNGGSEIAGTRTEQDWTAADAAGYMAIAANVPISLAANDYVEVLILQTHSSGLAKDLDSSSGFFIARIK